MRSAAVPLVLLLLFGSHWPASATPAESAPQQLLANARQKSDLTLNEPEPFQLGVDFTAQQNVPIQGRLELKWKDKEHWWRSIEMGVFRQTDIRNGGWLYTTRNSTSTPVRALQLIQLLTFAQSPQDLIADKPQSLMEYGVQVDCVRVKNKIAKDTPHQVCFNASHDMSSDTWWDLPDSPTRQEFSDYVNFAGHRYPRSLQLVENASRAIKATVKELAAKPFDDALLAKPEGAIERRQCDDWKPPKPVKTPDPPYPPSASRNGSMGDSIVSMTVLADGTATDFQLIGSASRSMDQSTLETLKKWKFKPAMCGSEPVVSDIEVIVSFRLN